MIGNKLEQSIISVFQEDLSETLSINSLSKRLKKSYPNINRKSHFLLKEGILGKIDIGRSYQCYLNLRNEKARIFVAMNEINKKEALVSKEKLVSGILDEINQLAKRYSVETALLYKKSIIFLLNDMNDKKEILERTVLTKDFTLIFFDKHGFQDYFLENEDLRRYHFILLNTDNYVRIISEINDRLLMNKLMTRESSDNKQDQKSNK